MAKTIILNAAQVTKVVEEIARQIVKQAHSLSDLVLVGIQTRGVSLTNRLVRIIQAKTKLLLPQGSLDITLYRDDIAGGHWLDDNLVSPLVRETNLPQEINNKEIILVDDVLFTGRTVRAALDELVDFGRPKFIRLAVLIDRGNREFPIQADFVGKKIITTYRQVVKVNLKEIDGKDSVVLVS